MIDDWKGAELNSDGVIELPEPETVESIMKGNDPKIAKFRSGGFINKDYNMGRVYVDLPIIEAIKLLAMLKLDG